MRWFVASRGHEFQDALMFARWGCDYLKYDWCASDGLNAVGAYTTMRDAIYAAKRPMVFSMCEWGNNNHGNGPDRSATCGEPRATSLPAGMY